MMAPFASTVFHEPPVVQSLLQATEPEQLSKAVEPFVLLKIAIDSNSQIQVTSSPKLQSLIRDRTHRFLVEIRNQAKTRDRLKLRVAGQLLNASSRQCEIGMVENIFSSAQLTGDELEWKLIELRCHAADNYEIEAFLEDSPAKSERRFFLNIPVESP